MERKQLQSPNKHISAGEPQEGHGELTEALCPVDSSCWALTAGSKEQVP